MTIKDITQLGEWLDFQVRALGAVKGQSVNLKECEVEVERAPGHRERIILLVMIPEVWDVVREILVEMGSKKLKGDPVC